jgi:hypothetical protein
VGIPDVNLCGEEPARWVLVFQRQSKLRIARWLSFGEFKHVSAYAFLPIAKAWLIFDVNAERTSSIVIGDGGEVPWLKSLMNDAVLISMPRGPGAGRLPVFGWCVPAIAHLLGLRTWALRPDSLYRYCLAHGGEPMR